MSQCIDHDKQRHRLQKSQEANQSILTSLVLDPFFNTLINLMMKGISSIGEECENYNTLHLQSLWSWQ